MRTTTGEQLRILHALKDHIEDQKLDELLALGIAADKAEIARLKIIVEEGMPRLMNENYRLRAELDAIKAVEPVMVWDALLNCAHPTTNNPLPHGTFLYIAKKPQPNIARETFKVVAND